MTTLWCENVLFGGDASVISQQRGSIDIDTESGLIVACHPQEEWVDAQARNPNGSHNLGTTTVLSPGFMDVHTHISALGRNWEGYETATKAAAAGGITTLMGMPLNSIPSTTTLEAVALEREQATREKLYVDVGLMGWCHFGQPRRYPRVIRISVHFWTQSILGSLATGSWVSGRDS